MYLSAHDLHGLHGRNVAYSVTEGQVHYKTLLSFLVCHTGTYYQSGLYSILRRLVKRKRLRLFLYLRGKHT